MDLYPWIVFIHAAAILLFFIAHGTSMAVGRPLKDVKSPSLKRGWRPLDEFAHWESW